MDISIGFTQVFSSIVELFGFIYTTGYLIFQWLSTPLIDSFPDVADLLGELAVYTPFELMFGPVLIMILIFALVKFLIPT